MSKLDVGVGDEFPLDEGGDHRGPHGRRHRHGRHHNHHHHHGMHGHRHHFHALPLLLILAGVAALVVAGKIPVVAAYAMIGLGLLAILALGVFRVRHFRRRHQQTQ